MGYNPETGPEKSGEKQPRETNPKVAKDLGRVAIGGYNKDKKK